MRTIIALMLLAPMLALAGGDDIKQVNNAGDLINGGDSALGLGLSSSLGDTDIGDCVITTQHQRFIVWSTQGFEENPFCEALALLRIGWVDAAIIKFCRDTSVGDLFDSEADCKTSAAVLLTDDAQDDDHVGEAELRFEMQQEVEEQHDEQLQAVVARVDTLEKRRRTAPKQVVQQAFFNEQDLAYIESLKVSADE